MRGKMIAIALSVGMVLEVCGAGCANAIANVNLRGVSAGSQTGTVLADIRDAQWAETEQERSEEQEQMNQIWEERLQQKKKRLEYIPNIRKKHKRRQAKEVGTEADAGTETGSGETADAGAQDEAEPGNGGAAEVVTIASITAPMSELLQEDGSYREAGPDSQIFIENAQDFRSLSEYTYQGYNTEGVLFQQTADIDCSNIAMGAIGVWKNDGEEEDSYSNAQDYYRSFHMFSGIYDGDNYHISNVVLTDYLKEIYDGNTVGLFGCISNATIRNLHLDSMDIVWPGQDKGSHQEIGVIVGIARGNSVIENCTNHADITAPEDFWDMAGIVNLLGSGCVVKDCANYGTLDTEEENGTGYARIAGIVASSWGDAISGCINYGAIKNVRAASGIVTSASSAVEDCENRGELQAVSYASGIAMTAYEDITNCKNTGNIRAGDWMASGIVSYLEKDVAVTGCENAGDISSEYYAGGMMGECHSPGTINRCTNTGSITAEKHAGGIAGFMSGIVAVNCTNEGTVSSQWCAGGIVGDGEEMFLSACVNRGEIQGNTAGGIIGNCLLEGALYNLINYGAVTSAKEAGGIVGCGSHSSVVNAWNHGDIAGDISAGGILGRDSGSVAGNEESITFGDFLHNCINLGTVSSAEKAGALIGDSCSSSQLEACYYLGGSAAQVSGTDDTMTAQLIEQDEWNTQAFVDELNQNAAAMEDGGVLSMHYDSSQGIGWNTAVVIAAKPDRQLSVGYQQPTERFISSIPMEFVLLEKSSGEYFPMKGGNGIYAAPVSRGKEYEIFRKLPDGTYQSQSGVICLGGEDSTFAILKSYGLFQEFSEIIYEKQVDGTYSLQYETPYYAAVYGKGEEIILPPEPVREGCLFGGWYTTPFVYNEELYLYFKKAVSDDFEKSRALYEKKYETGETGQSGSIKEKYVSKMLIAAYGYDTKESLLEHFDEYVDAKYKVSSLVQEDGQGTKIAASPVFAKWIAVDTSWNRGQGGITQNPAPGSGITSGGGSDSLNQTGVKNPLLEESKVLYSLNLKKKTAKVVGSANSSVKNVVIKGKLFSEGKSYKVTAIGKRAFADCRKIKKITVKGNYLKKVDKTAFRKTAQKAKITANKRVKKLLKKAIQDN